MINYETLISSYDDKLTLMQWLKKVEDALKNSVLTSVSTSQEGEEVTFTFSFEDGTKIVSSPVKVNQQVDDAYILNGHLFIHLADGEEIDAGNLFEGNVQMDGEFTAGGLKATGTGVETGVLKTNGTALDVFATEVNINTDVFAQGSLESETSIKTPVLTSDEPQITAQKPVVEAMNGYSFTQISTTGLSITPIYAGIVKNANKLTISYFFSINRTTDSHGVVSLCRFTIPATIGRKIFPQHIGNYDIVDLKNVLFTKNVLENNKQILMYLYEEDDTHYVVNLPYGEVDNIPLNTTYYARYEVTILLSNNLAA